MPTFHLSRQIPIEKPYDVVIAGGGRARAAAGAVSVMARLGARTLLVEATGCLGGIGDVGPVTAFDPMANGKVVLVGEGIQREVVEDLYQRGTGFRMCRCWHWAPSRRYSASSICRR